MLTVPFAPLIHQHSMADPVQDEEVPIPAKPISGGTFAERRKALSKAF